MADERAYRVHLRFNPSDETFTASVPELSLEEVATSRADAIEAIEASIDARMQASAEGDPMPTPIALSEVPSEITLSLTPTLSRDLAFYSSELRQPVETIALELLARGVGHLDRGSGRPERAAAARDESSDNRDQNRRGKGKGRRGRREGYRPELDDKANFMEYLRNLDKGKGRGGRR